MAQPGHPAVSCNACCLDGCDTCTPTLVHAGIHTHTCTHSTSARSHTQAIQPTTGLGLHGHPYITGQGLLLQSMLSQKLALGASDVARNQLSHLISTAQTFIKDYTTNSKSVCRKAITSRQSLCSAATDVDMDEQSVLMVATSPQVGRQLGYQGLRGVQLAYSFELAQAPSAVCLLCCVPLVEHKLAAPA